MDQEEALRLLALVTEYQESRQARSAEWGYPDGIPVGRSPEEIAEDVARLFSDR